MSLREEIQHNCNISDARDHGVYSMCTMILKLRNLYKWEHGLEPWQEAEPADLLEWIDAKEHYWEDIAEQSYGCLSIDGHSYSPEDIEAVNRELAGDNLIYGAGFGQSMKTVFFLAEKLNSYTIADKPVVILGKELAREMASPFAMAQNGVVYIRRDSLRFFLWDQLQELRSSCRSPLKRALQLHGIYKDDRLDQDSFRHQLDQVVDEEMNLFIYHEIGELLQTGLDSATLETIVTTFPGSVIELVCRTVKDILADTHPRGLLAYIISTERESSLGFYLGFLDGLRKELFPEIAGAWPRFSEGGDWQHIEEARKACRRRVTHLADDIAYLARKIGSEPDKAVLAGFNRRIIEPLGLDPAG